MKTKGGLALLGALLLAFALAAGCSSGGSDGGTGTLRLALTDTPIDGEDIAAVWVTIEGVSIHREEAEDDHDGEWLEPAEGVTFPFTVNLLSLQDGLAQPLGLATLPAGHYTQIRLHLSDEEGANYIVFADFTQEDLKVPSGHTSGLKLTHPFWIQENTTYDLLLDFDVERSIHKAGNSGQWIMQPTIPVIEVDYGLVGSISGSVTSDCDGGVSGVSVMAEQLDGGDFQIVGRTVTDEDGYFNLTLLPPGTYLVVAYKDYPGIEKVGLGLEPEVVVVAEGVTTQDVSLTCYEREEYSGTISLDPIVGTPPHPEYIVPKVTVVAIDDGPDYVVTLVYAYWQDGAHRFSLGLPEGDYRFDCDLGTVITPLSEAGSELGGVFVRDTMPSL